jgi:hypothetical protein
MRICAIIATRNRPQRAGGVVECARNLMSGRHDIEFVVACDADDQRTVDYFARFDGITRYVQPRPIGVGDCWNRAARAHAADFYLMLGDDVWISVPGWDAFMVNALTKGIDGHLTAAKLGIVSWYDPQQPTIASIFGMSRSWIDLNGHVFDPRFPFWWGDSALVETAIFATGEGMPGTSSLQFASMPGNVNPRLRDMGLWWSLYAATRHERVETAKRIARHAGLPVLDDYALASLVTQCEERDAQGVREIPNVMATITHPAPPDANYLAAKAQAEAYLNESARSGSAHFNEGEPRWLQRQSAALQTSAP